MADAGLTHAAWLERVPALVEECRGEWGLTLGDPYEAGAAGYTVRAELADGTPAVLKLIYPHRESEHEADALELWDGDGAVRLLAYDAERWAMMIERCEPGTPLSALEALRELPSTQGELVLVNQDLHAENVLAAQREPWLVIDPKPLVGEREFGIAGIVRSPELGHSRRDVLRRLDRLTSELGLDRERARGWTVGQTIAWSGGDDHVEEHVEVVKWLLE